MNVHDFDFAGERLTALPSGALFWRRAGLLCVSDLHLGKSERIARRGGSLLPPYEALDTLGRLDMDIQATRAQRVVCLGDSFDDMQAAERLEEEITDWLLRLQAGRRWIWIEGNHDPGSVPLGGSCLAELCEGPLTFRHAALADAEPGEISGHYHPKAQVNAAGRCLSRACFMTDGRRMILPAYGTYTGGLRWTAPELRGLFAERALAFLTGPRVHVVPVPQG